jgi:hypothetical protein
MEALNTTNRLSWHQPKLLQRAYELQDGAQRIGTLTFVKSGGSLAEASVGADHWTFKRVGFFRTRLTVRKRGEDVDLAVYHPGGFGSEGNLEFASGQSYKWVHANFWASTWQFVDRSGDVIIAFKPGSDERNWSSMFKYQAFVEINPAACQLDEMPLLVSLGWYLMILQNDDAAVAVVAAM